MGIELLVYPTTMNHVTSWCKFLIPKLNGKHTLGPNVMGKFLLLLENNTHIGLQLMNEGLGTCPIWKKKIRLIAKTLPRTIRIALRIKLHPCNSLPLNLSRTRRSCANMELVFLSLLQGFFTFYSPPFFVFKMYNLFLGPDEFWCIDKSKLSS